MTLPPVLLATFGSQGDLFPFTRLAAGLRERGRREHLIAPVTHEAALRESGLAFTAYGSLDEARALLMHPDLWHHRKGIAVILQAVVALLPAVAALVVEHAPPGPCVLACHPLLLPVADLARQVRPGLTVVALWLAPSNLRTCDDPLTMGSLRIPRWLPRAARSWLWRLGDRVVLNPPTLPGLNRLRAEAGLPAVAGFMPHLYASADVSVGLFPPWFGPRREGWPRRFVEGDFVLQPVERSPPLPAPLRAFLAAGEAPVVFTAGSHMHQAARFFEQARRALLRLGRRGVFVSSHAAQLPPSLGSGIHPAPFADFARIFPCAAAVVHHGGIGTTAEALRAGVPQLVMPFAFDQFDNAARVEALGVGRVLPAARSGERRLRRALASLLASTAVRERCDSMARATAASQAVDRVEAAMAQASAYGSE